MLIMANVLNQTVQLQIQVVQYGDLLPNWNIMRELRFLTFLDSSDIQANAAFVKSKIRPFCFR